MKFAFIAAEKAWPVSVMCEVLEVSEAATTRGKVARVASTSRGCRAPHADRGGAQGGAHGSSRFLHVLRRHGRRVSKKRIERLMREEGIAAKPHRKFCITTDS